MTTTSKLIAVEEFLNPPARSRAVLSPDTPQRGGRWHDHRHVLNGVIYRTRTGIP
ncbi:transposase [Nocardiopsis valliformis]|uniref:transposase n=1 Tax=Nocardiopsis valliformis TaxID=239974 RepID=UPI0003468048|nr:transposase [Nocardiopsis valliformis]